MPDKLAEHRQAETPLPDRNRLWPLYCAGFDELGSNGRPIDTPLPSCGPDELLVRHDARGLCFSDVKVIRLGLNDIVVLVPGAAVIAGVAAHLAPRGVMNVFAGVARGTMAPIDLNGVIPRDTRTTGHSGSSIDDLRLVLRQAEARQLSPNRSVAAIGSPDAARDGLRAVQDMPYPGKIVIYPNIKPLPLTALPDLQDVLPGVYALLKDGREWTVEAESVLLRTETHESVRA